METPRPGTIYGFACKIRIPMVGDLRKRLALFKKRDIPDLEIKKI